MNNADADMGRTSMESRKTQKAILTHMEANLVGSVRCALRPYFLSIGGPKSAPASGKSKRNPVGGQASPRTIHIRSNRFTSHNTSPTSHQTKHVLADLSPSPTAGLLRAAAATSHQQLLRAAPVGVRKPVCSIYGAFPSPLLKPK